MDVIIAFVFVMSFFILLGVLKAARRIADRRGLERDFLRDLLGDPPCPP